MSKKAVCDNSKHKHAATTSQRRACSWGKLYNKPTIRSKVWQAKEESREAVRKKHKWVERIRTEMPLSNHKGSSRVSWCLDVDPLCVAVTKSKWPRKRLSRSHPTHATRLQRIREALHWRVPAEKSSVAVGTAIYEPSGHDFELDTETTELRSGRTPSFCWKFSQRSQHRHNWLVKQT